MQVRIGIVGAGQWARSVHMQNLLQVEGARVIALCSRSEENRAAGAAACAEPPLLFERYEDMLACDQVDAVIVCTPNVLHAEQSALALAAGKHVLCEKPIALTREDAARVAEAASGSDRVLAVGFELRSADVTGAMRDAIAAGRIGAPLMLTGRFWRAWGAMTRGWRGDVAMSGGVVHELLSHTVDLHACLLGETPHSLYAKAGAVDGAPYWDRISVAFEYPSGAIGVANLCLAVWGAPEDYPVYVMGEGGRLVADVVKGEVKLRPREGDEWEDVSPARAAAPVHGFPGSRELAQEFVDCVAGRRDAPRCGLAEATATLNTCLAIEESIAAGTPVALAH